MPELLYQKKSDCCGCEACANVCPKGVIEMAADAEGFLYPRLARPEACVDCGRCADVCPVRHVEEAAGFREEAVAGYAGDPNEIRSSASGGLATALAKGFLAKMHGVVYGVSYTDDFHGAEYRRAASAEQLEAFRTSKYIQSRKGDIYQQVEADLDQGTPVLFIGLPCETYALQRFLGRARENLYVCSLVCHGSTSPEVQRQYVLALEGDRTDPPVSFSVRYKKEGWKPYYIRAVFRSGKEHIEKFSDSVYGTAFLYFKRPSCNVCRIKRSAIHADLTIGDYHLAAGGQHKPYHPDGVSSGVVHTEKGRRLLSVADDFHAESVPIKNVLYSEAYHRCIPARKNRAEFGSVFAREGLSAACSLRSIAQIEKELAFKANLRQTGAKIKKALLRGR